MSDEPLHLLMADPPWRFGDKLPGEGRGAAKHYATMSVGEICRFPIPKMAEDSLLILWRVSSMVDEAFQVAKAWGFSPKSEIVWVKITKNGHLHFGMGRYVRAAHETAMVAARGKARDLVIDRAVRSVFFAPVGEHSQKPDEIYDLAERLMPGPYGELFARRPRDGWRSYGLELIGAPASP